ncbi:DUF6297 family protein [Amorphoplanes digitatis]|uniref:Uncharacterized protein n=1 Tax=Actinoplanes digitatis TaxID=1868 RepID=A0A7W7HSX0_9ACTN|nr:DUF6297 family protein [Actinoplanes digitatis]MBB4760200.1 hypothetical protein [Actinoplanes digitatis]GID94788.1 hypothetical protein Adi01nite_42000 [Actinoplanes digitatis]
MTTTVAVGSVRRWVRRTRSAHRERGETLGNFYFAVLFVAIVGGMLHRQLAAIFWPAAPNASALAGGALCLVIVGGLYLALRRLGPLGLSRPAASWLLTAPVSRRRLLLPSLWSAAIGAALAGTLGGLAVLGHVAARPVPGPDALLPLAGALLGGALLLVALDAQANRRWSAWSDDAAYLLAAAGLAGLVVDSAVSAPRASAGWPAGGVVPAVTAALAVVVTAFFLLAVRRLARTPNERILEASKTAGTLLDSAFGVEPSFVTEMIERRYWARRRLRSRRLSTRVPVLVAQDLILLRRRPRRLLWLAGATTLPALLAHAPGWILAVAVLAGGLAAGGAAAATVRTDAGNPVLLRLLGLSSRDSVIQRLWVPGVLAALWYCAALSLLRGLGDLPAGPWWALGLVLGPAGAAATIRRARVGFVDNGLLPLDTPMGSFSTGPAISAFAGLDVLLLGLPTVVQIAQGTPLTWTGVAVQGAVAALGARAYVSGTTEKDRVELSAR